MTDLKQLLTGERSGRVIHWYDEMDADDAGEIAAAAGWRLILLDTIDCDDESAFLRECDQTFDIGEESGLTWDDLFDALTDMEVGDGVVIWWTGWQTLEEDAPDTLAAAAELFHDLVRRRQADGDAWMVLMVGADEVDIEVVLEAEEDEADDEDEDGA